MKSEISPQELLEDLQYFESLTPKDGRVLILLLELHLEHFIHKLAKEKQIKKEKFLDKVDELNEQGIIQSDWCTVIRVVYKIRNRIVHNLRPNVDELEQLINEIEPTIEDAKPEFKEALSKSTAWSKIQLYTIPVIIHLYKTLMQVQNKEVEYKMILKLTEKNDTFYWGFELLKKQ